MNTKKYIAIASVTTMLLSGAMMVSAESNSTGNVMPAKSDKKMVLQISQEGKVLLRGTVSAVGTTSLTVKSWGGDWVVNTSLTTKFAPGTTMSQVKVGDFVGVQGMVLTGPAWTIDASLVRNWTEKRMVKENKEEVKDIMRAQNPKNWDGTASNVSSNSFTLTVDGTVYTVNLAANAKIVNKGFMSALFSDVKNGDRVRVYGPAVNSVITAFVVRDMSTGL